MQFLQHKINTFRCYEFVFTNHRLIIYQKSHLNQYFLTAVSFSGV
jgi:hypothetical protein